MSRGIVISNLAFETISANETLMLIWSVEWRVMNVVIGDQIDVGGRPRCGILQERRGLHRDCVVDSPQSRNAAALELAFVDVIFVLSNIPYVACVLSFECAEANRNIFS